MAQFLSQSPTGYRYGLCQPTATFLFKVPPVTASQLEQVDQWLTDVFTIDIEPLVTQKSLLNVFSETNTAEMGWRILQFAGYLLQSVRVPSFDPGCLLSIERANKSGRQFLVKAAVPYTENLPTSVHKRAYLVALPTVIQMLNKAVTEKNRNMFFDELERVYIQRFIGRVPGGASTIPILSAAFLQGIPFSHQGRGIYQLGYGKGKILTSRSSVSDDSAIGARVSHDKFFSTKLLRNAGLPGPEHILTRDEQGAKKAAKVLGIPIVVKPLNRDRGEGVAVDIYDQPELLSAFNTARDMSHWVIIEKQVPGTCHRFFISHGTLFYVSKRIAKSVTGDGLHTVAQLIDAANAKELAKPPWKRLKPFPADDLAKDCLGRAGFCFDDVIADGKYGPLRKIQSVEMGGVAEDMTKTVHPDNIDIALRAVEILHMSTAGVDIISEDISIPWHQNGAIINEINYAPFLSGDGRSSEYLIELVTRMMEKKARISIEVYVGGSNAFFAAKKKQNEKAAKGINCYVTSHNKTLLPSGKEQVFMFDSLFDRCMALLMDVRVEMLLLVVQGDELLKTGLPIGQIDQAYYIDAAFSGSTHGDQSSADMRALHELINRYTI